MGSNANADTARRFFEGLAAGDFAGMGALLADDVVLTIPGSFSRTFRDGLIVSAVDFYVDSVTVERQWD